MTVIAVVNNQVYTDSYCVTDGFPATTNKVRKSQFGHYAVAGNPSSARMYMDQRERAGDLFLPTTQKDPDHTCIVLRAADGQIYTLFCGAIGEVFTPVVEPDSSGLQYVAGSGRTFFLAYYAEHRQVETALRLTAQHHSDVAEPFPQF